MLSLGSTMVAVLQRKIKNGLLLSVYVSKLKKAGGLIGEFMGLVFSRKWRIKTIFS